jgi:hypothetical protein
VGAVAAAALLAAQQIKGNWLVCSASPFCGPRGDNNVRMWCEVEPMESSKGQGM